MRIIHHSEHAVLAQIAALKPQLEPLHDPVQRAPLKAQLAVLRQEHAAIRAAHLPAKLTELRAEHAALVALPTPRAAAVEKQRRTLEKEIPWLEEEAARLDIKVEDATP